MPGSILRPGALDGCVVAVAGSAAPVEEHCAELGAAVERLEADLLDEEAATAAAAALSGADVLVVDAATPFTGGLDGYRRTIDGAWNATRAVANAAWIAPERPGRVVLIAPPPDAGEHASAVRAAVENMARTLSTEWARYGVTVVALLPGEPTTAGETADIVAFLASEAGAYYAGCAFTLGAVPPGPRTGAA